MGTVRHSFEPLLGQILGESLSGKIVIMRQSGFKSKPKDLSLTKDLREMWLALSILITTDIMEELGLAMDKAQEHTQGTL